MFDKEIKTFVFLKHKHITLNINLVIHYILRRQIPNENPHKIYLFIFWANIFMFVGVENIRTMNIISFIIKFS